MIIEITNENLKADITRNILEQLKDWFEIESSREEYIKESRSKLYFAYYDNQVPVGFISMKETSKDTLEIYVMGVLKKYHRNKIGTKLFNKIKEIAKDKGYSFIQVKTVQMGYYDEYDKTNKFYLSFGFKELEVIPSIWDDKNPCQIYVMAL